MAMERLRIGFVSQSDARRLNNITREGEKRAATYLRSANEDVHTCIHSVETGQVRDVPSQRTPAQTWERTPPEHSAHSAKPP